ncbi:hypothetical protein PUN28_016746 [Cardiocondyla obscurior]|uniref:Uncharacterized protein n=1 Tax=Cardiocondyla obscurior TaxID=286306 RepID=A0AAW2EQX5_9HYME
MEQSFRHSSLSTRRRVAVNSVHGIRDAFVSRNTAGFSIEPMTRIGKITESEAAPASIPRPYARCDV